MAEVFTEVAEQHLEELAAAEWAAQEVAALILVKARIQMAIIILYQEQTILVAVAEELQVQIIQLLRVGVDLEL
ncbi:MAG: hypothetical protein CME98_20200 [Hyphomonas sp.]|nr:hypothetical protein [Hyphomonas sp.]